MARLPQGERLRDGGPMSRQLAEWLTALFAVGAVAGLIAASWWLGGLRP